MAYLFQMRHRREMRLTYISKKLWRLLTLTVLPLTGLLISCTNDAAAQFTLDPAFPSLMFNVPVDLQFQGTSPEYLFVVERGGVIRRFANSTDAEESDVFLDIRHRVLETYEEGLLGLAFHPQYDENGRFFVYYNAPNPRRSVISEFLRDSEDPAVADPNSERTLLEFNQPGPYHNGGQLRFGPDGYLYISTGDGGGGFSHDRGTGEDLTTYLGSILRIDVDQTADGDNYRIPASNPFADDASGFRKEIFAYGFRNPWRFSFDREDLRNGASNAPLFVADVGGAASEEVNIVRKGLSYGWSVMEGRRCYSLSPNCESSGRALPLWEYGRESGTAVIGGFVYRGSELPSLYGRYIYGDLSSGRIWALEFDADMPVRNDEILLADSLRFHAFGEDGQGELYVVTGSGRILKIAGSTPSDDADLPDVAQVISNHPNALRERTIIRFTIVEPVHVRLSIYNVLGQEIRTLVDADAAPGSTHAMWDAADGTGRRVPAGVYFYRLTADSRPVGTGRMILVP